MTTEEKLRIIHTWTHTFGRARDAPPSDGGWYAWIKFSPTQKYAVHTSKWDTNDEMIEDTFATVQRYWWDKVNGY